MRVLSTTGIHVRMRPDPDPRFIPFADGEDQTLMRSPLTSLLTVLTLLVPAAALAGAEGTGIDRTINRQLGPLGDPSRLGPGGAVEFALPGFDWPRLVLRPEVYVTDQGTLGTAAALGFEFDGGLIPRGHTLVIGVREAPPDLSANETTNLALAEQRVFRFGPENHHAIGLFLDPALFRAEAWHGTAWRDGMSISMEYVRKF